MTRIAINGFGRIGRLVARALLARQDSGLELVTISDLADAKSNALLFKRDSVHGPYPGEVSADGNDLVIDGRPAKGTAPRGPGQPPPPAARRGAAPGPRPRRGPGRRQRPRRRRQAREGHRRAGSREAPARRE